MLASYIAKEEGKIALYYIIYKTPKNINLFKNSNKVSISNFSKYFIGMIHLHIIFIPVFTLFISLAILLLQNVLLTLLVCILPKYIYIYNRGRNLELYYIIV